MATARELNLQRGNIVRVAEPIYEDTTDYRCGRPSVGRHLIGLDMSRGRLARVLKMREDSPLLQYLDSSVPIEDIGTLMAYNWVYSEYVGLALVERLAA